MLALVVLLFSACAESREPDPTIRYTGAVSFDPASALWTVDGCTLAMDEIADGTWILPGPDLCEDGFVRQARVDRYSADGEFYAVHFVYLDGRYTNKIVRRLSSSEDPGR
jgi:hypothetical protein